MTTRCSVTRARACTQKGQPHLCARQNAARGDLRWETVRGKYAQRSASTNRLRKGAHVVQVVLLVRLVKSSVPPKLRSELVGKRNRQERSKAAICCIPSVHPSHLEPTAPARASEVTVRPQQWPKRYNHNHLSGARPRYSLVTRGLASARRRHTAPQRRAGADEFAPASTLGGQRP